MRQPFPPGFLWGCATSACQIEGSPLADGAGVIQTLKRTPKASARHYARVIASHGIPLDD